MRPFPQGLLGSSPVARARPRGLTLLCAAAVNLWAASAWAQSSAYQYLSPQPGSEHVSPWNNVAIRFGEVLVPGAAMRSALSVVGSSSGVHRGSWSISDDGRTLLFAPDQPYTLGERVSVGLSGGAVTASGRPLPPLSFQFDVAAADPRKMRAQAFEEWAPGAGASNAAVPLEPKLPSAITQAFSSQPCDTMPSSYLTPTVLVSNQPDSGYIFLSPSILGVGSVGHLMIVDNLGIPIFAQALTGSTLDFKVQANGQLSYWFNNQITVLDSSYAVVDHWVMGNGYLTDSHECLLLPNGHALLLGYDTQPVDMSKIVPGGNPAAQVTGLIVQELDASKNVIFQWRSWDHYKITDMIEVPGRSFTDANIDWVHGNAIEVAQDGNLLISARHMDEITKIDRQSGATIWRLGLNAKNNDFTFVNETRGFSHQHDIRQLPNGDITMFDNGDYLTPQYSRGVEYALDETNHIATKVWEYRHVPDIYGQATGSNRRRSNGGTLIEWGLNTPDPKLTDLHPDNTIGLELGFGQVSIFSYRGFRFPWKTTQFTASLSSVDFGPSLAGQSAEMPVTLHNHLPVGLPITCFATTNPQFYIRESTPFTLSANADTILHLRYTPSALGPASGRVYLRSVQGSTLVAQVIEVAGSGTGDLAVGDAASRELLWLSAQPNPARGSRTLSFGLPQPAHVTLEIFDLAGRHVATPFAGAARAGANQVSWSAHVRGAPLSSGVYFAVLTTPLGTRTIKLVSLDR